jgi:hypothetical protein
MLNKKSSNFQQVENAFRTKLAPSPIQATVTGLGHFEVLMMLFPHQIPRKDDGWSLDWYNIAS